MWSWWRSNDSTMEPLPPGNTHPSEALAGGSSLQDRDAPPSASSWGLNSPQKRKWHEGLIPDLVLIGGHAQPGVALPGEGNLNSKNKQAVVLGKDFQDGTMTSLDGHSDVDAGSSTYTLDAEKDPLYLKGVEADAMDYEYPEDSNEYEYYDDEEYEEYEYNNPDSDDYYNMASKFDGMDLPAGVEATVPWLQSTTPEKPQRKELKEVPCVHEVAERHKQFKQFDTVTDYSDHHFANKRAAGSSKAWAKRIQQDWKLLEKDLPSSIIVRVYEERLDLLRAVIIGPAETPYHDGLFFFDAYFPPNYPSSPPWVHYHSGGLRLNPNLYDCGKVCLSLLGTWPGKDCEKWNSEKSSTLQVLLSIQALVLNEKPYFNEPGYANSAGTVDGERKALAYNELVFPLSCKTMLYALRNPPKHFEDYVAGHFRERGRTILTACLLYLNGCKVGCKIEDEIPDVDLDDVDSKDGCISRSKFKSALKSLYEDLLMEFTVKGADCGAFLAKKVKKAKAAKAKES